MRNLLVVALPLLLSMCTNAQEADEAQIRKLLDEQVVAWNKGDLSSFMKTYWNNDSLMFVGKSGVTYGYTNTLERYKQGYPDTAAMGRLRFEIISLKRLSPEYFFVAGKYILQRTIGDAQGHYTLLLRKIDGRWIIICDHSS